MGLCVGWLQRIQADEANIHANFGKVHILLRIAPLLMQGFERAPRRG